MFEQRGQTEIEEAVAGGELISSGARETGWIEKLAWRTVGPSEKKAAEFLWPRGASWTQAWTGSTKWLAVTLLFVFGARQIFAASWVTTIGMGFGALYCLWGSPAWREAPGLSPIPANGMLSPMYA